ncbi:hypothetical protein Hanom_Chr06g00491591 [Helianthus anomalus]
MGGGMGGLGGGMGSVGGSMGGGRLSRTDYRYRPVLESGGVHQRGGFVLNLLLKTICTC